MISFIKYILIFLPLLSHTLFANTSNDTQLHNPQTYKTFLTKEENQWIADHPVITACTENDWAPFSYFDKEKNPVGLSKDYLDAIAKIAGLNITYQTNREWTEILQATKEGKCDLLNGLYFNQERTKIINFTTPYLTMKEYFFTRDDEETIYSMSQLKKKKLALVKGYDTTNWVKKNYPTVKIIEKDTIAQCLYSVATKESDAFIGDNPSTRYNLEENFITGIKICNTNKERKTRELLMGTKKEYKILADILSKSIKKITEKQDKEIKLKWMDISNKNSITLSKKEQEWLTRKPSITYVFDPNWKPFEWKNELGEYRGIISDIIKIIAQRSGIKFIPSPSETWTESTQKVKSGEVAMFSSIGRTKKRDNYLNFTKKSLFSIPYVLVSRKSEDYLNGFEDTLNKKVVTIINSTIQSLLQEHQPNTKPILVDTIKQGLEKVKNGQADVLVVNATAAKYYINILNYNTLKIAYRTNLTLQLKIAFNKNAPPEALSIVNKTIQTISTRELDDIFHKWTEAKIQKKIDWTLVWSILIVAALIILLFILLNKRLRYLVQKKTIELQMLNENLERKVNQRTKELTQLNEKLSLAANTDPMTGAYNRRYFFDASKQMIALSKRNNLPMCIAMLDIDKFKNINDTYGHDAGDIVIKEIVEQVHTRIREEDILVRFGGEEFLILLPNTTTEEALIICERTRETIENSYPIENVKITVSIGISELLETDSNIDIIVKRADTALYEAKRTGRNKVIYK